MMTVSDVSKRTGVSIRALQYYDKIGLLKASAYTEAGYRLYEEQALDRLQQILLFRELEFSLKDIQAILESPHFDRRKALRQQVELLELKREHTDRLIALARNLYETGAYCMDFSVFDKSKQAAYAQQAKEQWGRTDAYREFAQKSRDRTQETEAALGQGLMELFARMGQIKDQAPDSPTAQGLVKELQSYITEHYYHCTSQILRGLGQMYAAGGDFTENIDAAGGPGTAEFANAAIEVYTL